MVRPRGIIVYMAARVSVSSLELVPHSLPASECVSPLGPKGGGATPTFGLGGEGPNSDEGSEGLALSTPLVRRLMQNWQLFLYTEYVWRLKLYAAYCIHSEPCGPKKSILKFFLGSAPAKLSREREHVGSIPQNLFKHMMRRSEEDAIPHEFQNCKETKESNFWRWFCTSQSQCP